MLLTRAITRAIYTYYKDRFCMWLAFRLPRHLAYWCAIRVMSYATVGKWGNEYPSELKAMTGLDRWMEKNDVDVDDVKGGANEELTKPTTHTILI